MKYADVVAWAGVSVAGSVIAVCLLAWLISLLRSEMGRGIVLMLLLTAIMSWGLLSVVWLIVTQGM